MSTQVVWVLLLVTGIAAVIATAMANQPSMHLGVAAAVAAVYAARGILVHRAGETAALSRSAVAAGNSMSMALVWLWGGLSVLVIYTGILTWREWWQFALAFTAVGVVSLGFAAMLGRDAAAGKDDAMMLKLARNLTWVQLVGMIVTMLGLIIDPDKRFLIVRPRWEDWAANSIFFFGAAALAVLSAYALLKDRR